MRAYPNTADGQVASDPTDAGRVRIGFTDGPHNGFQEVVPLGSGEAGFREPDGPGGAFVPEAREAPVSPAAAAYNADPMGLVVMGNYGIGPSASIGLPMRPGDARRVGLGRAVQSYPHFLDGFQHIDVAAQASEEADLLMWDDAHAQWDRVDFPQADLAVNEWAVLTTYKDADGDVYEHTTWYPGFLNSVSYALICGGTPTWLEVPHLHTLKFDCAYASSSSSCVLLSDAGGLYGLTVKTDVHVYANGCILPDFVGGAGGTYRFSALMLVGARSIDVHHHLHTAISNPGTGLTGEHEEAILIQGPLASYGAAEATTVSFTVAVGWDGSNHANLWRDLTFVDGYLTACTDPYS